jgi:chromosomal replication initiation ATPase DnaA
MITVSAYFAPGLNTEYTRLAKKAIRDLNNYGRIEMLTEEFAKASRIIDIVCEEFNISRSYLVSENRSASPSTARHLCAEIIWNRTKLNQTEIGKLLNRNRTTIIHSIQQVTNWKKYDVAFAITYERISVLV